MPIKYLIENATPLQTANIFWFQFFIIRVNAGCSLLKLNIFWTKKIKHNKTKKCNQSIDDLFSISTLNVYNRSNKYKTQYLLIST